MGSDDFISLDETSVSENQGEDNGHYKLNSQPSEADCRTSTSHMNEEIPDGDNFKAFEENGEREEVQHIQQMDLEVNSVQKQPILEESVQSVESLVMVEKLDEFQPEQATDNGCALNLSNTTANNLLIDESPIAGVKRARMMYVDQQPSVRVVYNSLTRESKKKLMDLMQQWSEWHAQCNFSSNVLECGEETYFPALHVGSEKTSTVSFWVDNKARKEDIKESIQLDNDLVPLYDRGYTLGSTSVDGSSNPERIETLEASRCFNCGSYTHSLKECPKPRDNAAINNARKQHNSKRNPTPGSRGQARYYQKSPGKFDDLKAGVLGPETRESLGIGESDPPPWLHRMRELGYPPGYLDVVEDEDQPSGITIFADDEETTTKVDYEDGEIPEKGEHVVSPPLEKTMTVEFPGINAPIPENADNWRWAAAPSGLSSSNSFKSHTHHRLNRSSESHRSHYPDHQRTDVPPRMDYGSGSNYSPRYSPYDHNNSPMVLQSPNLGRSFSDRPLRSPTLPYERSPAHSPRSPYPYAGGMTQQLPAHQYHSPLASLEHWAHDSPYGGSPDVTSQQGRDWHDHHHRNRHHHHHDRRHDDRQ